MTNRQWMETLTDEHLARVLTTGLRLKSTQCSYFPFDVNIRDIAVRYTLSASGIEQWLSMPQEYEVEEG